MSHKFLLIYLITDLPHPSSIPRGPGRMGQSYCSCCSQESLSCRGWLIRQNSEGEHLAVSRVWTFEWYFNSKLLGILRNSPQRPQHSASKIHQPFNKSPRAPKFFQKIA